MTFMLKPSSFTKYADNYPLCTTLGTLVSASATPHTKNSTYTELISSVGFDVYYIEILIHTVFVSGTDSSTLVDIAIGAAASETVIIPNLNCGGSAAWANASHAGHRYAFPLYIPSGSRLSANCQSAVASKQPRVLIWVYGEPSDPTWVGQHITDYGTNLATSRGVSVALGTGSSDSAWTEIVAATTRGHNMLCVGPGLAGDTSSNIAAHSMDLGIGSATEVEISANFPLSSSTFENLSMGKPWVVPVSVQSGERIVGRGHNNQGQVQSADLIVYGVS